MNTAPAAEASFVEPNPNMMINGTKYIPPPIPTAPAIKPSKDPKKIVTNHFSMLDKLYVMANLSKNKFLKQQALRSK